MKLWVKYVKVLGTIWNLKKLNDIKPNYLWQPNVIEWGVGSYK